MKMRLHKVLLAAMLLAAAPFAKAQVTGTVYENLPNPGDASDPANFSSALPNAGFTSPAVAYDSGILGYTVSEFLNNPTFYNQANGFDPNYNANGSGNWGVVLTGLIHLNAGINTGIVEHDDGLTLYINGQQEIYQPGPTSATPTGYSITVANDGDYPFVLNYTENSGPPAVLDWTINQQQIPVTGNDVPEVSSTLAMLAVGLGTLTAFGRKSAKSAQA